MSFLQCNVDCREFEGAWLRRRDGPHRFTLSPGLCLSQPVTQQQCRILPQTVKQQRISAAANSALGRKRIRRFVVKQKLNINPLSPESEEQQKNETLSFKKVWKKTDRRKIIKILVILSISCEWRNCCQCQHYARLIKKLVPKFIFFCEQS